MKIIYSLFVILLLPSISIGGEKVLDQLINSHKVATQYFKTIRCDVHNFQSFPEKNLLASGNYIKSKDLALVNQGNGNVGMDHYLLRGGEIRGVGRSRWENGEPTSFNAFRWPKSTNLTWCDAFTEMLLQFKMPDGSYGTLEEYIQALKAIPSCRKITINGMDFIELKTYYETTQKSKISYTYLFDISKNCLVSKMDYQFHNVNYKGSASCMDFFEVSKGVYFPKSLTRAAYRDGKKVSERTVTISNLRVNEPIPEEILALPPIPDETFLIDNILGKEGPVDSNWQWIRRPGKSNGPIVYPGAVGEGELKQVQSESEPLSCGTVLGISGSSLLVLSALVYLVILLKK